MTETLPEQAEDQAAALVAEEAIPAAPPPPLPAELEQNRSEPAETGTPRAAVTVSIYLFVLIVIGFAGLVVGHAMSGRYQQVYSVGVLVISAGGLGGVLLTSRTIVFTVRYGTYDHRRILWQIWTPIHGGMLGGITALLLGGGLLIATSTPVNLAEGRQQVFLVSTAFLAGFASEVLVKRLIAAAEALFGESSDATLERTGRTPPGAD